VRFLSYSLNGKTGLAALNHAGEARGYLADHPKFPGNLDMLVRRGDDALAAAAKVLLDGAAIDLASIHYLPPFVASEKILCVGLNYVDHSKESGYDLPSYPTIFGRFTSSLIGHEAALVRPKASPQFDYEGELVAVIGKGGRHIPKASALDHVAGYSLFNDGSVRDFQHRTPQWTVGKNFDGTGAFGPWFVTADELPQGARGLQLQTRLNGEIVQSASTDDLVFDVATLVSLLSEAMTLTAGDIIVTGTPSGVGVARKPPLFMKAGDVCEIEVEGLGILRNPVVDEQ
jgi:2-keto-4-pentenoate hydratase/2-oxohepta-3-ene-1,7-dioic acid hydratase in catechol pathway